MRFLKSTWTPFFLTLLIGTALNVEAARNLIADMLYLMPASLPTSGKDGYLRVDSSDNKLKKYNESTTSWEEITGGGGTGGINHILESNDETSVDFEVDTGNWVVYADAAADTPVDCTGGSGNITFTRSTSSPLRQTANGLITKDAVNRQGEGISIDFDVDRQDSAAGVKPQTFGFNYEGDSNFDVDDIKVFIYDVDNSELLDGISLKDLDGSGRFVSSFTPNADSDSYRLCLHQASTSALATTLKVDTFFSGPAPVVITETITDWHDFTPTGAWTTNTTYTGKKRRVGDSLEFEINIDFTGAPNSATLTINLPSGLSIDTSKIDTDFDNSNLGQASLSDSGVLHPAKVRYSSSTAVQPMYIRSEGSSNPSRLIAINQTAPFTIASGDKIHLRALVPISGWGTGKVSAVAADSNRPVSAEIYDDQPTGTIASTFAGSGTTVWDTVSGDTHGAYSSGSYTVPVSGRYIFSGQTIVGGTEAVNNFIAVRMAIDGTEFAEQTHNRQITATGLAGEYCRFNYQVELSAGQVITFRTVSTISSAAFISVTGGHFLNIHKLDTGSPLASLAEPVIAMYGLSSPADTSLDYNAFDVVDYDTKVKDTHNAVTTGASWTFTAPRTDFYTVSAGVFFTASAAASALTRRLSVSVFIDGSENKSLGSDISDQTTFARNHQVVGSVGVYLEQGQELDIRGNQNVVTSTAQTLLTNSNVNFISIKSGGS